MNAHAVQPWDTRRVADAIESYWRSSVHEQLHREALVDLVQHCLPTSSPKLLEVGCGSALIYERLAAIPTLAARYVGVDSSNRMLAIARRKFPHGPFLAADGSRLPFRDGGFDVTLCFEVLGHLTEVDLFLAELIRVTRQTVLFTIWPSEGPDVIEGQEEIDGVTFPHRAYSDAYIREILVANSPTTPRQIELYILSADCWAYAVHLARQESVATFRVAPLRGYQRRTMERLNTAIEGNEARGRQLSEVTQRLAEAERFAAFELAKAAIAREELTARTTRLDETARRLREAERMVAVQHAEAANAKQELAATARCLEETNAQSAHTHELLASTRKEAARVNEELAAVHSRFDEVSRRLAETEGKLALWQYEARALSTELAGIRLRRALRIADRFRPSPDLAPQIDPAFQNLLDDSYLFLGNLKGYRLQPSENLQTLRVLAYALTLGRANLSGLMLAPIIDLPDDTGSLGIELATPDGTTVAHARVSFAEIGPHRPVRLVFPPVLLSAGSMVLRVDVRDTATPARLFEWRKRRFLGLGPLATRPFCAFIFE